MGKHQCHVILFSNLICFLSEVIFSMRNGGGGHESREDNSWTQRPMAKKERVRLLEPGVAAREQQVEEPGWLRGCMRGQEAGSRSRGWLQQSRQDGKGGQMVGHILGIYI